MCSLVVLSSSLLYDSLSWLLAITQADVERETERNNTKNSSCLELYSILLNMKLQIAMVGLFVLAGRGMKIWIEMLQKAPWIIRLTCLKSAAELQTEAYAVARRHRYSATFFLVELCTSLDQWFLIVLRVNRFPCDRVDYKTFNENSIFASQRVLNILQELLASLKLRSTAWKPPHQVLSAEQRKLRKHLKNFMCEISRFVRDELFCFLMLTSWEALRAWKGMRRKT